MYTCLIESNVIKSSKNYYRSNKILCTDAFACTYMYMYIMVFVHLHAHVHAHVYVDADVDVHAQY